LLREERYRNFEISLKDMEKLINTLLQNQEMRELVKSKSPYKNIHHKLSREELEVVKNKVILLKDKRRTQIAQEIRDSYLALKKNSFIDSYKETRDIEILKHEF
jgi:hypothetical protein